MPRLTIFAVTLAVLLPAAGNVLAIDWECPDDTKHLQWTASLPLGYGARDLALDGATAWVAGGDGSLYAVDLADPLAPAVVGSLSTGGAAIAVVARDGFAYVAGGDEGLQIVDVGDPLAPALAGSLDLPGYCENLVLDGGRA
ncbi:MAG: PQQ-binding-like beta-propeller repeat protein, partial [bacterium]|nr:PQQ-binding-like beta-propeller repeat protein [bacterium]